MAWSQALAPLPPEPARAAAAALAAVRLHLFHVLQTLTPHSADADVGVPARGLHGEAYRGHVFWDELFVFPVLSLRMPEVSRGLLLYRYRRLPAARRAARAAGTDRRHVSRGSPRSTGREESQRLHLNPVSGRWVEDVTHRQRHVGLAVAYNTWQYWQATGDRQFLDDHGAEMILEVARFFADLAEYDAKGPLRHPRRHGPGRVPHRLPGSAPTGIDNNAYTNVMVVWVLLRAADALRDCRPTDARNCAQALGLTAAEERTLAAHHPPDVRAVPPDG